MAQGVAGGVGPTPRFNLSIDVGYMALHRAQAQDQFRGDLLVAPAQGDESQHLYLSLSQAVWIRRSRSRLRGYPVQSFDRSLRQRAHAQLAGDGGT